ncbi:PTS sugar transporter subunit IIA [Halanaerobacter jeridensis]|uniref:PTS system glucose-specific IIA component n=1 Tax=Halanaerobacter jeridensis TaxID=706427 RepID=A0A938XYU3_9FIRM|nr:PTS glucose transporter subunit IIA [Halanaerobacter jeridensis]MBM7558212.1 PTS system glucose-specific IIA component [Halanaerobacter jeridensis]
MFNVFKSDDKINLFAPMDGRIVKLEELSDPAFSQKMLGDGIAIDPSNDVVVSPCEGEIVKMFDTNHAVGIETEEGVEILIHIGIDTVKLAGEGFTRIAEDGDKVNVGDELIRIDREFLKENAPSLVTPIVITNSFEVNQVIDSNKKVASGKDKILQISL